MNTHIGVRRIVAQTVDFTDLLVWQKRTIIFPTTIAAPQRIVRLEEYASSGTLVESESVDDALSRVKVHATRSSSIGGSGHGVTKKHVASASHRQNDKYMEEFDAACEELEAAATSGGKKAVTRHGTSAAKSEAMCAKPVGKESFADADEAAVGDLEGSWLTGPMVPEGSLHSVSAQPLMCMSVSADAREVVVGSSNHALYVIPLRSAAVVSSSSRGSSRSLAAAIKPKTLYTKKFGHTEWVTCVTHLPDNRIVSGGMDSKLCLWDATGVKCEDLRGHSGSVSLVQCLGDELVVSAGYDKTIRVWNVGKHTSSRQREQSVIKAGSAPILDASTLSGDSSIVCGDRDGSVHLIDLENAKVLKKIAGAHKGHTTSVLGSKALDGTNSFYSGGQDGIVKVWDARQKGALHSLELHIDPRSGKSGAIGFLRESAEDPNALVVGGADGTIKVLDKRASFGVVHNFTEHMDFIYSLHLHGQLCFSGAGNGMLHVHDWKRGKLLYGLGANQAAVRAIATSSTQLIAAGDDGGVVVYDM
ncbi:F-box protein, partial [Globisporangium splendens]